MDFMVILGQSLSESLNKPLYHCVGLIRLSIKDSCRNPDSELTYQEYKEIIQVNLLERLQSLYVRNPEEVTSTLLKIINDKQSLFTMSIH